MHRRAVPRRLRVKGHPGVVVAAEQAQRGQDPGVDDAAAMRARSPAPPPAGRSRDGTSASRRPRRAARTRQSSSTADGGHSVTDSTSRSSMRVPISAATSSSSRDSSAQPRDARQHRVACRRRHRTHPGLQHLGDVERVSAGQPVQRGRIEPASCGQDPDRARGQRRQPDPPGRSLRRQARRGQARSGSLAVRPSSR